jgi:hypothetical protein
MSEVDNFSKNRNVNKEKIRKIICSNLEVIIMIIIIIIIIIITEIGALAVPVLRYSFGIIN